MPKIEWSMRDKEAVSAEFTRDDVPEDFLRQCGYVKYLANVKRWACYCYCQDKPCPQMSMAYRTLDEAVDAMEAHHHARLERHLAEADPNPLTQAEIDVQTFLNGYVRGRNSRNG